MIAGAPGAFGSLVIFNSSGEMGCHSSPALTGHDHCQTAPRNSTETSTSRRRQLTIALPFSIGGNAKCGWWQERKRSPHLGAWIVLRSLVVVKASRLPALGEGPVPWALLLT